MSIKIDELDINNFKNIVSKHVQINGRSFVISAKNGSGKSSVMDAILSPFDPTVIPEKSITDGEEKGRVSVTIKGDIDGEEKSYVAQMRFTPANQKGELVLLDANGKPVKSPRTTLDTLFGQVSIDIEDFLRGNRKEDVERRIKLIKKASGKEKELDVLEINKKNAIENREKLHGVIRSLEGIIYNHGITDEQFEKHSKIIPIEPIQAELDNIQPAFDKINRFKERFSKILSETKSLQDDELKSKNEIQAAKDEIANLEAKIAFLKNSIREHESSITVITGQISINKASIAKGEDWLKNNPAPDIKSITTRLSEAQHNNQIVEKIQSFQEKQQDLFQKKAEYEKLNNHIQAIDEKRKEVLKNSSLPVEGLTYDENGLYLNGLPLKSGQINTAKLLEIGEDIMIALNSNLKVIFVRDGSLYDKENLTRLVKRATDAGYQVIVEVVSDSNELEIIWMEDYLK